MSIRRQHIRNDRASCEAGVPFDGEYLWDQTLKAIRGGDGTTAGGFLMKRWGYSYQVAPPQITANQNDYNPSDHSIAETMLLDSDAARSITGLAGGAFGRNIKLINRGEFELTLVNASALSIASNRFQFESDIVLRAGAAIELQYSTIDSRWMRTSGGAKFSNIPQELLLSGVISPAAIVVNTNDYAPAGMAIATTLRLSTNASRNLTGLVDARDGAIKMIINIGLNPLVLKNADAGSSAANRFDFGADVTLAGKQSAVLRYDGADGRWKLLSTTAGSAVAAGAVTAQTLGPSAFGMSMINGTIVTSVAGSALTIAIKTLAATDPSAADPVYVLVRSSTPGNGDFTVMTLTAATSLVISSGSSMGVAANNSAFRLWVVGFNDAGTFRLGAINCLSGTNVFPLRGWGIGSSTAEGGAGAADNAQTFYTGAAVAAKPFATLGYLAFESGLAAAGTWSAAPTRAQLFGPGVPLPGDIIQIFRVDVGAVQIGTTVIPVDDTIPQITEGDQYLAQSIVPTSSCNLGRVAALICGGASIGPVSVVCGLFRDSVANALTASAFTLPSSSFFSVISMNAAFLFNSATSTTLRVRAGLGSAGTFTFNGLGGSRYFGGSANSMLSIEEVMT